MKSFTDFIVESSEPVVQNVVHGDDYKHARGKGTHYHTHQGIPVASKYDVVHSYSKTEMKDGKVHVSRAHIVATHKASNELGAHQGLDKAIASTPEHKELTKKGFFRGNKEIFTHPNSPPAGLPHGSTSSQQS